MAETTTVQVLWARPTDERYSVQFVAAFCSGLVEALPEAYDEQRATAEEWYRGFGEVAEFFTTWEQIQRPEPLGAAPRGGAVKAEPDKPEQQVGGVTDER